MSKFDAMAKKRDISTIYDLLRRSSVGKLYTWQDQVSDGLKRRGMCQ
jgi:hypothetical protein